MTTIYVTDANIFIDLHDADLLTFFGRLELAIVTTALVLDELNDVQQHDVQLLIEQGVLILHEISIAELSGIELPKGLSVPDRSVIIIAQRDGGILLSGDKLVRNTAKNLNIQVHGLLWIFDQFVEQSIIAPDFAATKLIFLTTEKGRRQPDAEVAARILKWRASDTG